MILLSYANNIMRQLYACSPIMPKFFQGCPCAPTFISSKALTDAVSAVINGASLSLTSIGRHLPGQASVKHKMKRTDRLLGNTRRHDEVSVVFSLITRHLVKNMTRVFILVDWISYPSESFQLLRASLACDGLYPHIRPIQPILYPGDQQGQGLYPCGSCLHWCTAIIMQPQRPLPETLTQYCPTQQQMISRDQTQGLRTKFIGNEIFYIYAVE